MYLKDKKNRITLRLTDEQFDFIKKDCDLLGISPSDYLRMVINSSMALSKQKKVVGANGRENDKSNINYNV